MDMQAPAELDLIELHISMLLALRKTYKPNPLALLADSYMISWWSSAYSQGSQEKKTPHVYLQKLQQMPAVICVHTGVKLFCHSGLSPSR